MKPNNTRTRLPRTFLESALPLQGGARQLLRLDRTGVAEYAGLSCVCFSVLGEVGRESHDLWLGIPSHARNPPLLRRSHTASRLIASQNGLAISHFMKNRTIIVSLIAALCLLGCSKEGGSSSKSKRLVSATAAEVMASSDYKLEHTTESGIKCYVRPLTPEIAKTVKDDSPDHEFLNGDEESPYYFLVLIRNGKIIDGEAALAGAMTAAEAIEVMGFVMARAPQMQKMLKEVGEK